MYMSICILTADLLRWRWRERERERGRYHVYCIHVICKIHLMSDAHGIYTYVLMFIHIRRLEIVKTC